MITFRGGEKESVSHVLYLELDVGGGKWGELGQTMTMPATHACRAIVSRFVTQFFR